MGAALLLPRLRPDQWAIVEHPAKVKVVCAGRRYGKTLMSGAVALSAASQGGKVLWMAPTYKNTRPIWRWAEIACLPLVRRDLARLNKTERIIEFPASRGFLGVFSADNDTAVRGDWFNLAILDEAARIPESTWTDVVQPALADANGDAILPSTPAGKNWFWREWQRGVSQMDGEIASFTAPSSANPNPNIQRAAELAKERVPDATYRQEWLAEFVASAHNPYDPSWWTATEDHDARRFDISDERHWISSVARFISWDTAFKDKDTAAYSAVIVGELTADYRLLIRHVWRDRLTFPHLKTQIERLTDRYIQDEIRGVPKLQGVVIEDQASGISAYQTLMEEGTPAVRRVLRPFNPKGSKEQRGELAAVWCQSGCVLLPHPSPEVPWLRAFEEELFSFPDSEFKDMADAFAQLILYTSKYLSEGREARQRAALPITARALEAVA